MLLLDNEEVIQAFSPHTTQKTFANGIGLRGLIRGSKHLDATGFRYSCKMLPEFPIIIPNQVCGYLPIWRCLPQLLRNPGIGGGSCHIHVHDFPRFQLDDEKGKQRTEEEIGDLQEITGPHLCCMIAEKGLPSLSTSAFWMDLLHILLNGPFTHANLQLEQFSTDALCSPESVIGCHLLNQGNRLGRKPWFSRAHL